MATSGPTNLPAFFNTDADFRSWGSAINAALASLGLVQTSDTGQINWTTVTKPSALNTAQGYEIWKFADSLQATKPVFFKLEYGSGGAADRPGVWLTVGIGSNGSGTLTGANSRRQLSANTSKTSGVTLPAYFSGSTNRVAVALNLDSGSNNFGFFFSIERSKDSSGVDTSDCIFVLMIASAGVIATSAVPFSGTPPGDISSQGVPAVNPNQYGKSLSGSNGLVAPIHVPFLAWLFSLHLVSGSADWGALGTVAVTHLGASHTYLALNLLIQGTTTNLTGSSADGGCGLFMLFE